MLSLEVDSGETSKMGNLGGEISREEKRRICMERIDDADLLTYVHGGDGGNGNRGGGG